MTRIALVRLADILRFAAAALCSVLLQNNVFAQAQIINRVAGNGYAPYRGEGGPAIQAQIVADSLAVDHRGNVYLSDFDANFIRVIDGRTGIVTTYAGTGQTGFNGDGLPALMTNIGFPKALAIDADDNLIIAEQAPSRILKVNHQSLTVETLVGTDVKTWDDIVHNGGASLNSGDGASAKLASIGAPDDLAVDTDDNLYIAAVGLIRRVDHKTGIITTVAGGGIPGAYGSPASGPATAAALNQPSFVAIGPRNEVYFGDQASRNVRRLDRKTNTFSTIAGVREQDWMFVFNGDGIPATQATLLQPVHITFDCVGNLTIPDLYRVRQVDGETGIIHTIAGAGGSGVSTGDGGLALQATFSNLIQAVYAPDGSLYLLDGSGYVRRVSGFTGTRNWDCRDERRYHGYDPEGPDRHWHHQHDHDGHNHEQR